MDGVSQDSAAMKKVAEDLTREADEYKGLCDQLFTLVGQGLGATDDGQKAWFGPNSAAFLANFKKKEPDFENAHKNIVSLAKNLHEQAEAWANFENN